MAMMPNRKALLGVLGQDEDTDPYAMGTMSGSMGGIQEGEGTPNAGPAPVLDQPIAAPTPAAPVPTAPDYTKRGKFATFNAGADDKYNRPWDQMSERYKMQTVLSNFDPNAGITPDVIAALNAANINGAQFSGGKDKLDARGLQNWENYDGREGIGDIIQGFNDPNRAQKTWGAWQHEGGDEGGAAMGGGGLPDAGGLVGSPQLDSALSGDPLAKIQQLIAQMSGSRPNFAALMQQLGGG